MADTESNRVDMGNNASVERERRERASRAGVEV
jgi:hypothetical protein